MTIVRSMEHPPSLRGRSRFGTLLLELPGIVPSLNDSKAGLYDFSSRNCPQAGIVGILRVVGLDGLTPPGCPNRLRRIKGRIFRGNGKARPMPSRIPTFTQS
jgi:hypothetical protein